MGGALRQVSAQQGRQKDLLAGGSARLLEVLDVVVADDADFAIEGVYCGLIRQG